MVKHYHRLEHFTKTKQTELDSAWQHPVILITTAMHMYQTTSTLEY